MILMERQHSFFKRQQRKTYCHIYAWFGIKVDIVTRGHFYVTGGFLMLILGHRSHNCWSSEIVLLICIQGSQDLSQKLTPFAYEFDPGPFRGMGQGRRVAWADSFTSPWNMGFHVCWVWILKSGPVAIVPHSSDTVCTIWPMLDPPPSDPCICGKRACEGIRSIYCLLLPALGKSRVQYSGTILFCRNINIK